FMPLPFSLTTASPPRNIADHLPRRHGSRDHARALVDPGRHDFAVGPVAGGADLVTAGVQFLADRLANAALDDHGGGVGIVGIEGAGSVRAMKGGLVDRFL